ncbi:MAG: Omp28-related outer membrane protein [Chitinophagales bacterium]
MYFKKSGIFFLLIGVFFSCEEIGPEIRLTDPEVSVELVDTSYLLTTIPAAQEKRVLIEDFTGVKCINCPKGHDMVDDLRAAYPGKVIPVAMHSNFLANPYAGDQDLRSPEAQSLDQRLGPTIAKPTGAVNRVEVNGEQLFFINEWAQICSDEIAKNNIINVHLENTATETEQVLVKVRLEFLEEIQEALSISVFLLENDIEVTQLTPDGEDEAYIHNHVLRRTLTPFAGSSLELTVFEAGRVIEKEFELITFEESWNPQNFEVVAFVHQSDGNLTVYQSAVLKL